MDKNVRQAIKRTNTLHKQTSIIVQNVAGLKDLLVFKDFQERKNTAGQKISYEIYKPGNLIQSMYCSILLFLAQLCSATFKNNQKTDNLSQ